MKHLRAFTLVEVMVALAVVAISLMAGVKAMNTLTDNTEHLQQNFLGNLCLQNSLAQLLLNISSTEGEETQTCTEFSHTLDVKITTRNTQYSGVQIVKLQVFEKNVPLVATVTALSSA